MTKSREEGGVASRASLYLGGQIFRLLKFIYSEKATTFCEISTVDLSYVLPVKSTVQISQNFVAFSEFVNFNVANSADQLQCQKYAST